VPTSSPEPYRAARAEAFAAWAAEALAQRERRWVIDIGCGVGTRAARLASAGARVLGVDEDDAALREAFRRYSGPSVTFRRAPLPRVDEPQHSFDAAVCDGMLERLADPMRLLDEIRRLLRPGGLLVLRTPNRLTASPGRTRPIDGSHAWQYTPDELFHLLRRRMGEVRMFGIWHGRRLRWVERAAGEALPLLLDRVAPPDRAPWIRASLVGLRPGDFQIGPGDVRSAIDLVAIAEARTRDA